jgi:hypothetical protein
MREVSWSAKVGPSGQLIFESSERFHGDLYKARDIYTASSLLLTEGVCGGVDTRNADRHIYPAFPVSSVIYIHTFINNTHTMSRTLST